MNDALCYILLFFGKYWKCPGVWHSPICFCDPLWVLLHCTALSLKNVKVGCTFGFGGTWKCDWGIENVATVESLQLARKKCLPLLQLESNVFERKHLLPQEIGTYCHRPCARYYRTLIFLLPLTHHLMSSRQSQNSCSTLLVEWNSFFILL